MFKRICCCISSQEQLSNQHSSNDDMNKDTSSSYGCTDEFELMDINWSTAKPFVPPINEGLVIKCYDGDTITIAAKMPYKDSIVYRFPVRLNGIDCPEMKSKNSSEKECAQLAKEEVTKLVLNKIVVLKNVQTEKYGRILADVYIGDLHLNKHLLDKRLAVVYDGGTKKTPDNWMEYYNSSWNIIEDESKVV